MLLCEEGVVKFCGLFQRCAENMLVSFLEIGKELESTIRFLYKSIVGRIQGIPVILQVWNGA